MTSNLSLNAFCVEIFAQCLKHRTFHHSHGDFLGGYDGSLDMVKVFENEESHAAHRRFKVRQVSNLAKVEQWYSTRSKGQAYGQTVPCLNSHLRLTCLNPLERIQVWWQDREKSISFVTIQAA